MSYDTEREQIDITHDNTDIQVHVEVDGYGPDPFDRAVELVDPHVSALAPDKGVAVTIGVRPIEADPDQATWGDLSDALRSRNMSPANHTADADDEDEPARVTGHAYEDMDGDEDAEDSEDGLDDDEVVAAAQDAYEDACVVEPVDEQDKQDDEQYRKVQYYEQEGWEPRPESVCHAVMSVLDDADDDTWLDGDDIADRLPAGLYARDSYGAGAAKLAKSGHVSADKSSQQHTYKLNPKGERYVRRHGHWPADRGDDSG